MIYVHKQKVGNAEAIVRMLNKLAIPSTSDRKILKEKSPSGIILPGNGSFDPFMLDLTDDTDLIKAILDLVIEESTPILGICVGMQAMFRQSEEGVRNGLGIIKGDIKAFPIDAVIPNLGWRTAQNNNCDRQSYLPGGRYYFSHSYASFIEDVDHEFDELLISENSVPYIAAFRRKHIFGAQFHPEKSSICGFEFISKFYEFCMHG